MLFIFLYFYIWNSLCLDVRSNKVCMKVATYDKPGDVIIDCNTQNFTADMTKHYVKWGTMGQIYEDKYPYVFLKNGSLLILQLSLSSSHHFCDVIDKATEKLLQRCGTSIIIQTPLTLSNLPINETVEKGTVYHLNCQGGGDRVNRWKLRYFVNDKEIKSGARFIINEDTKVGCSISSEFETIAGDAYIKVKRRGDVTDKEKVQRNECQYLTSGICRQKHLDVSRRIYWSSSFSGRVVELILNGLFHVLDTQVITEDNENKCLDRFGRLLCSTLQASCKSNISVQYSCRESCEVTLLAVCRNTMPRMRPLLERFLDDFFVPEHRMKTNVVPAYELEFVQNMLNLARSVFNCSKMNQYSKNNSSCVLLNLDVYPISKKPPEPASSECYNEVGRNYVGKESQWSKCVDWRRVPSLSVAFYQQHLWNQSSFCRNPGGIFNAPMCPVATVKGKSVLSLTEVMMVPCVNVYSCSFWKMLKKTTIEKGSIGVIVVVGVILMILVVGGIVIYGVKCANKKFRSLKRFSHSEEISLKDEQTQLYSNKVYMYKNVQNGHYSCPIYNSACLERVFKLTDGAYGEILLVQAVFEDSSLLFADDCGYSSLEKSGFGKKSSSESDDNSMDDFILSKDKTFNGKPCWPFDKSSPSGCSPFAVIKYSIRSEKALESRFAQETKILSLLNYPNIMRFYGVTVDSTGKIISRIIEYLPNGTLYSILVDNRSQPFTIDNHNRNKIENGYQKISALQKHRLKENNVSTMESKPTKRKKTVSSQSRELEPPKPTEHIDLNHKQLIRWIIDICDAVIYLHTKHFLHRDIATRNCLVGLGLETKLADFNFVQKFTIGHDLIGNSQEFIPIRWLPKETLEELKFNIETDTWMFGVFMWEVMSLGKQPYWEFDLNETCERIISGHLLPSPDNCPDDIYEQMKLCWQEANSRPCLETVKNSLKKILDQL